MLGGVPKGASWAKSPSDMLEDAVLRPALIAAPQRTVAGSKLFVL